MKRLFCVISLALMTLVSCQPEEPVDYSGPVKLYREGDSSYVMPFDQPLFSRPADGTGPCFLIGFFFDIDKISESFNLEVSWPYSGPLHAGETIKPETVTFVNPYQYGDLGYTQSIERGILRYMGEKDGKALFRFEDLTFKVTRRDGSGRTDIYYARGTAEADQWLSGSSDQL